MGFKEFQPHPNPLLEKERENSPLKRTSRRLGFLPQQKFEGRKKVNTYCLLPAPNPCLARFAINGHGSGFGPLQSGRSLIRDGKSNLLKRTYRPNVLTSYRQKKCAFTLSEFLITLGIIGVVAALTIPNLMTKYQKMATVQQLKKGYTLFANAFNYAQNESGPISSWDEFQGTYSVGDTTCSMYDGILPECTEPFVNKYLSKYLKIASFEKRSNNGYPIKNLLGYERPMQVEDTRAKWFYLSDGSCFLVSLLYDNNLFNYIFYDLNGDKKPNILGRDIFVFDFGASRGYKFGFEMGFAQDSSSNPNFRNVIRNTSRTACSKTGDDYRYNSFSCGALIQYDGWEIKDDYPW